MWTKRKKGEPNEKIGKAVIVRHDGYGTGGRMLKEAGDKRDGGDRESGRDLGGRFCRRGT